VHEEEEEEELELELELAAALSGLPAKYKRTVRIFT
jgi:hypothetical protein